MDVPTPDLYLAASCRHEDQETLVRELVAPLAARLRDHPELETLFFVRMNLPTWQVRLRFTGPEAWLAGACRQELFSALAPLGDGGPVLGFELTHYQREVERYGGEEGMRLAEQLYHHDSLACLELMRLEAAGELQRSRRELAMLYAERLADSLGMHGEDRSRYYRFGYQWAFQTGDWGESEMAALNAHFEQLQPGFQELYPVRGEAPPEADLWGSAAAAEVGAELARQLAPWLRRVRAGCASGSITADLAYLGWSYAHLLCNRLGIDPAGEAVQRYLMHLYHFRVRGQGSAPGPLSKRTSG